MSRKGVAKIVNKDKNKVYVISSNNDIVIYLDKVMSDLENGWHKNSKLQQDYFSNPNAFTTKLITTTCKNEIEVNEVRCSEIKKYWPNGHNKKCTTSHRGGNTNPFERSGENEDFIMTGFMERLFDILNESNLPQEGKDFLEDIIDEGFVTSEYDLIRAIRDMERLLDILNKSKLKSKDKKDLKEKIMNGTIFSEDDLKTEIENILKTYKSKSKNKKSSNKNSSSRNKNKKPKKHIWEEYDKTHNTKPKKKTFQEKLNDDLKTEKRYGVSQYKNYPKHKRKFNISKNIKNFAIILCILFIVASAAMFLVGHLLPPSSASFDDEVVVDIGGDGMLIAQLDDSLIINEENISDGLFNTAQITNLPWIDAKNISYVDYAGIKGYMIVWKTSIDHYNAFDNKNVVNYLSGPVKRLSANCFVAYSPETDSVYGIILSNHNEYNMEGDLLYKVLNLNSKDFKLSYGHDSDLFYT